MDSAYRPLPDLNIQEIKRIVQFGTIEEQMMMPLAIGEYHSNWKIAQDICVELTNHVDERVKIYILEGIIMK